MKETIPNFSDQKREKIPDLVIFIQGKSMGCETDMNGKTSHFTIKQIIN